MVTKNLNLSFFGRPMRQGTVNQRKKNDKFALFSRLEMVSAVSLDEVAYRRGPNFVLLLSRVEGLGGSHV